ncbi:MAG: hypothetical protein ACOCUI_00505 [bacterium]
MTINEFQKDIVYYLKGISKPTTTKDIQNKLGYSYNYTLKKLKDLEKKKYIIKEKYGRSYVWKYNENKKTYNEIDDFILNYTKKQYSNPLLYKKLSVDNLKSKLRKNGFSNKKINKWIRNIEKNQISNNEFKTKTFMIKTYSGVMGVKGLLNKSKHAYIELYPK